MKKKPKLSLRKPPKTDRKLEEWVTGESDAQTSDEPDAQATEQSDDQASMDGFIDPTTLVPKKGLVTRTDGKKRRVMIYFEPTIAMLLKLESFETGRTMTDIVNDVMTRRYRRQGKHQSK